MRIVSGLWLLMLCACTSQESADKLCREVLPAWGVVANVTTSTTDSWGNEVCAFSGSTATGVHVYGAMNCGVASCLLDRHVCEVPQREPTPLRILNCLHESMVGSIR